MNYFATVSDHLRDYPDGDIWSDGTELLCKTESAAKAIADLIWQLYSSGDEDIVVLTGYYDPVEDKLSLQEDQYTGWWYVNVE